jgi:hypothetical protein
VISSGGVSRRLGGLVHPEITPPSNFHQLRDTTRGAAMKKLSHSASFHSKEKIAPSKSGIKHLATLMRLLSARMVSSRPKQAPVGVRFPMPSW